MPAPSLDQVIQEAIAEALESVHTALPGRVESYDQTKQTASVKPLVRLDGLSLPILANVPIAWLRAGGAFLSFPVQAGDFVFILFAESSIDQWRAKNGIETDPGDVGRHTLTGAVALPLLYPSSRAIADTSSTKIVLGFEGGNQVRVGPGGIEAGAGAVTDGVARGSLTDARIAQLRADLTTLKAAIVAGFNAVVIPAGGGTGAAGATAFSGAATAVPAPAASVASAVLFSD